MRAKGEASQRRALSWIASWLWPEPAAKRDATAPTTATADGQSVSTTHRGRGDHHNHSLSHHPDPSLCVAEGSTLQTARTPDVLVQGAGLSQGDLVMAANTTQQWLTAIKTQLGLTGLAGLSGTDAIAVCLSVTNDGQVAVGSFQGLRLKPLSLYLASGGTQADWQSSLAHALAKTVAAVLLQDRTNRHPLPRWFEEGMAAYLSQAPHVASLSSETSWVSQYNPSGQCGPLDMVTFRDLQRCQVMQESLSYRPAYAALFHLLFDNTASGGAALTLSALTGVLTNMAYGSPFPEAFNTWLGGTAAVAWHGHPLAPSY